MHYSNALLSELFTRDGSGTLVTAQSWEHVRKATIDDVNGILELITPLQENGTLAERSAEQLELDIENFVIAEREGMVIACAALFVDESDPEVAEIACVVTHPEYQGKGRAATLVRQLETNAKAKNVNTLLLLTTRTAHWFIELGYSQSSIDALSQSRKHKYNEQRASKVFVKTL